LSRVKTPSYFISTVEDHIAPWKGTYRGARHLGGIVRFVLGGSGHIAGIVNPPAAKKYHYWTNDKFPPTAEEWFADATQRPGSWWDDWRTWVDRMNGSEKVSARAPGDGKLKPIEDAPGSYAMLRIPAKVK
jgi:polyhydroxyalkanoate synthase